MASKQPTDRPPLTFSDGVAAIDGKGPGKGGWYNGKCPAHGDTTASLGIEDCPERIDGTFAIKCHAGCTRKQVVSALEQKTGKRFGAEKKTAKEKRLPAERGLTLQQYADLKKLPVKYLKSFCTFEESYNGKPAVVHTYFDENVGIRYFARARAGLKYRLSVDSHDTVWIDHKKSVPYGLGHLWWFGRDQKIDWIVICEGESDTQTLFFNGIPAIGISGKNGWSPEFARLPQLSNVKEVVIIQEPDAEDFVKAVAPSFPDKRVCVVKLPAKDPSALWLQSKTPEEFLAAWDGAMDSAKVMTDGFTNTDTGNAERLVDKHGGNFRWIDDEGTFCAWDQSVWRKNTSGDVLLPMTKEVVRAIPDQKWRRTSESSPKRHAMIGMAKGEAAVLARRDVFDTHPMLLNVANGTLDLEKQELREVCREDFLTKKAPVSYDKFSECPKFDEFMTFTFGGDQDLIHFMDKALGYTLTGKISESVFFMCYGQGSNGKTTLLELMMQILGPDFVTPAKFSTFVESKFPDQSGYEVATFPGTRMITAVEPRKAGRLNEELLKQLTGGDMMKTRQIYGKPFAFYPECKLWMSMNNQPRIAGTDEGIWRRVRLIPFTQTVPEARKVKDFHKVLFNEEGSGILNRLLRGLKAWQEEGLQMPGAVANATTDFRATQNVMQGFFDTVCLLDKKSYKIEAGKLYKAYQVWAEEQNEFVIRSNEFKEELERRKLIGKRGDSGFIWRGITLRETPEESDSPAS
jgi:P4 family phage/plasmid primase-like protien